MAACYDSSLLLLGLLENHSRLVNRSVLGQVINGFDLVFTKKPEDILHFYRGSPMGNNEHIVYMQVYYNIPGWTFESLFDVQSLPSRSHEEPHRQCTMSVNVPIRLWEPSRHHLST